MDDYQSAIESSFTLDLVQALIETTRTAYSSYRATDESFGGSRYGLNASGLVRNRQVDLRMRQLAGKIPKWEAREVQIPKTGHVFTLARLGDFVIVICPKPRWGKLPKKSKARIELARRSLIAPMQQPLLESFKDPAIFREPDDGALFAVLEHADDGVDKSKLAELHLLLVSRAYEIADSIDLFARARHLRDIGVSRPEVATPVVRKKQKAN
jgi:hypothetical protein